MLSHVLADGLDHSNGAMLLIPLLAVAAVVPVAFAIIKRPHGPTTKQDSYVGGDVTQGDEQPADA